MTFYPNGTTRWETPGGLSVTVPQVLRDTFSSGTRGKNKETVSNFFDIQFRQFTKTSQEFFNNGSSFMVVADAPFPGVQGDLNLPTAQVQPLERLISLHSTLETLEFIELLEELRNIVQNIYQQSINKPPRESPDPVSSLCVTGGQDWSPAFDLDVSELDNTLPPLEQLIGSVTEEQLKAENSHEPESDHVSKVAEFEEWALENVLLKRIMVNGVATFQLQFDWNMCATHGALEAKKPKQAQRSANGSASQRRNGDVQGRFTSDEDDSIIRLKEELQLSWTEIHRQHTEQYPGRSKGSLQVRYCTKLKDRKQS
ncbi:Glyoxalase/bleomycin resistance protein/dioxygenase [Purpureocillium lavendulum]|uniref:Glyoxalase/bleomycin resistance protein/dioxygenase n=1 Tax=Purpureocillium lavendulum TaxID=1247861 RepID=A0AB34FF05_9HYPO|nr:Glyoxalase/bleomycin resistance protein/dioxygenase [Purpureocillium lavendulum]